MGTGASLSAPTSVRKLRTASHAEAKRALGRRVAAAGMHGRGRHGGRVGGWVGSWRGSPGRRALAGRQPHDGGRNAGRRQAQLRVGESMISSESPVREIRTLGSMSGERKRGQGGEWGTGMMAKAAGKRPLPPPSTSAPLLASTGSGKLLCGMPDLATQGLGPNNCLLVVGVQRHSDRVGAAGVAA